jgi:hypothetical protein
MRSLWQYIETLQPWKQISLVAAFFLTLGFSLKEAASLTVRMYKEWRERCEDDALADYLVDEKESTLPGDTPYGQPMHSCYRSTLEAATAIGRSSVEIHRRLCRLEESKRVERLAPKADAWTITDYELHDAKQRQRRRKWFQKRK